MLWSNERQQGFREEIERTFHARQADAGRNGDGRREFTFASYGVGRDDSAGAFDRSHKRRSAAMGAWLASLPKPVAVFAANDLWGFELVQAARELRLHVPDDVALLGVDNEELLCEIAHPPLSSIRMGAEQIGHAAVSLLERLLLRQRIPKDIARVPPLEVVTRQSSDVLAVEDPDVAAALRHIRQHALRGLNVKELLNEVPLNRRTLERRFVSVLGHTPLEEIRRIRIERAKVLLQTDLPMYEVASRSGFGTAEYLATSLRQATGSTPTAYRRQFAPRARWLKLPPT
jgi:LacI family transcriptional regulator